MPARAAARRRARERARRDAARRLRVRDRVGGARGRASAPTRAGCRGLRRFQLRQTPGVYARADRSLPRPTGEPVEAMYQAAKASMARVVPEQMVDHRCARACADRVCDRTPLYVSAYVD